jgi:dynein regulatry complex protein 1
VVEIPQDLDEFNENEGHAPEIDKEDVVEIL